MVVARARALRGNCRGSWQTVSLSASYHLDRRAPRDDRDGRTGALLQRRGATRCARRHLGARRPRPRRYPLFNDAAVDAAPSIAGVEFARGVSACSGGRFDVDAPIARIEPTGWLRLRASDGACLGRRRRGPGTARAINRHTRTPTASRSSQGARSPPRRRLRRGEPCRRRSARVMTRATRSPHNTVELFDRTGTSCDGARSVGRRGRGKCARRLERTASAPSSSWSNTLDARSATPPPQAHALPGLPRDHRLRRLRRKPFVRASASTKTRPVAFVSHGAVGRPAHGAKRRLVPAPRRAARHPKRRHRPRRSHARDRVVTDFTSRIEC